MSELHISDAIRYVGVDDTALDLFESQYPVPNGVSYNAYVILDEKLAVLDTVDRRFTAEWLEKLEKVLAGRRPDYLVIHHLEPDHAGSIGALTERYPEMTLVASAKALAMLPKYFSCPNPTRAVAEGDTLSLGQHSLTFLMAPMVHWPEVMMSYETAEKTLFSADGFGTFGALGRHRPWLEEARRYYYNIVGKYGAQVQALLKKADALDIRRICPLHGPVLTEDLGQYIGCYDRWSRWQAEDEDGVLVAYASIHGNTAQAAKLIAELLTERGARVTLRDLCREDQSLAVEDAFRCRRMVALAATYDGGLFPPMEHFLAHLRDKTYRCRMVALVENGSWAPAAGKLMTAALQAMRDITLCEKVYSLCGAVKESDRAGLAALADELLRK